MGFGIKSKLKRRNSEKRKEKSRDAARTRRSRETEIFMSLSKEVPVSASLLSQMDKASVIRLAITHLKIRNFCERVLESKKSLRTFPSVELENKLSKLYYKAVDGFVMVVSSAGNLVYASENIVYHLGLPQVEFLGQSIFEFVHPCDHSEFRDACGVNRFGSPGDVVTSSMPATPSLTQVISCSQDEKIRKNFFVRMKCIHPCKGRSSSVKTNAYKVIHCSGFFISCAPQVTDRSEEDIPEDASFLVVECESILHPSHQGIRLDCRSFVTQHTMDMKFVYCDDGISPLLGYSADQLIGTCFYEFHHALDNDAVICAFRTLFSKGQSTTGLYRFLAKNGGYAWVETQASLVNNPQTDKPQSVICINHVVTDILDREEVLGSVQHTNQIKPQTTGNVNNVDESMNQKTISCEPINKDGGYLCENFSIPKTCQGSMSCDGDELDLVEEEVKDSSQCDDGPNVMFATERIFNSAKTLNEERDIDGHEDSEQSCIEVFQSYDAHGGKAECELPSVSSNASLFKLLRDFDDDGDELRAPFIPMDDLIFVNDASNSPAPCPVEMHDLPFFVTETVDSDETSESFDSSSGPSTPALNGKYKNFASVPNHSDDFLPKFQIPHKSFNDNEKKMNINKIDALESSSVLRNLLLKGEDTNYGYHLMTDCMSLQHKKIILGNGPPSKVSTLYQLLCS